MQQSSGTPISSLWSAAHLPSSILSFLVGRSKEGDIVSSFLCAEVAVVGQVKGRRRSSLVDLSLRYYFFCGCFKDRDT